MNADADAVPWKVCATDPCVSGWCWPVDSRCGPGMVMFCNPVPVDVGAIYAAEVVRRFGPE